jgi:hypothetical protein
LKIYIYVKQNGTYLTNCLLFCTCFFSGLDFIKRFVGWKYVGKPHAVRRPLILGKRLFMLFSCLWSTCSWKTKTIHSPLVRQIVLKAFISAGTYLHFLFPLIRLFPEKFVVLRWLFCEICHSTITILVLARQWIQNQRAWSRFETFAFYA